MGKAILSQPIVDAETHGAIKENFKQGTKSLNGFFSGQPGFSDEAFKTRLRATKDEFAKLIALNRAANETAKTLMQAYELAEKSERFREDALGDGVPKLAASVEAADSGGRPQVEAAIHDAAPLDEVTLIPRFDGEFHLPMDDYLITCDYHSPYHSIEWHNRSLDVAKKRGIRNVIIIGDLVDFGFASFFYTDNRPTYDMEKDENKRLIRSFMDNFDKVYLVKGNHEDRLGRMTDGKLQVQVLLELWTREEWQNRFQYSPYDRAFIGSDWMLVHPKSYSQISGQVAKKLAAIKHMNVINAHGHFLSYGYDMSGKFLAVDMGGMFDVSKIEYKNIKTSTHPEWNNGFGILKDGHFEFFDKMTNWGAWQ